MSCPYYWYNNHYACRKSEKDVNEDIYSKYCKNYDYGDCPIYKGQGSSGCFLTSACIEAKGLSDDCHELTLLRRFRDDYLRKQPSGRNEIKEYYRVAPEIVEKIKCNGDCISVFNDIYEKLVCPCVQMIECGENEQAHALYRETVQKLMHTYL